MRLILEIVVVLLIVRAVLMFVRGVMQGSQPGGGREGGSVAQPRQVQLMRDPVCGVYVTPSKAITERSGAGTAYFCSEKCRDAWVHR
jgi:YHS domain-containing protein